MRKWILLAMFVWAMASCQEQGPVRLVSAPEVWQPDENPVVILDGVRKNGINNISFWYDTIIRGGMRPADTLVFPSLKTTSADFEAGSRHRLYIDLFRDSVHVQRIIVNFKVGNTKAKGE